MTGIGTDEQLAARIGAYLETQLGRAPRIGRLERFPVGFSWLTFLVPVDDRELILRLGPDFGLFAPYSAAPQVQAMQSLEGTDVPVPRAFWSSDDPTILGAPFLFCERAEGDAVVPWVAPSEPPLEDALRLRLAHQFIDSLAALHRVDWRDKPICAMAGDVNEDNAALRSVQTWEASIRRWQMRPYPLADWGLRWLKMHSPRAPRVTVVHGDYRTGNFLQSDGTITAILDWELVHLGDPHEDLAWASMPMYRGGTPYIGRLAEPDLFYGRYGERVGFDVSMASVHYYQAFSLLKLAATHMAAARCFEEGRFNDLRMPAMGSQIATCLRQMVKTIEAQPPRSRALAVPDGAACGVGAAGLHRGLRP